MPDVTGQLRRLFTSWRGDVLLAVLLMIWAAIYLGTTASRGDPRWTVVIFVLPWAAALAARRRWPAAAAVLACALLLAVRPLGLLPVLNGLLGDPSLWVVFLVAYTLGTGTGLAAGLAGAVLLAACLLIANGGFSPVALMVTIGPWLAGRVVVSRRRLTEQLRARNEELRTEQELFALESVRYERARIARELHDIVGHCLSVMVVQASAGQRIADADGMAQALQSVAAVAEQAQAEIGGLAELLGGDPPGTTPRLQMAGELVRQATRTGLAVSCRFEGPCDQLSLEASEAAYRVVQEALTNALKHAPGAPVDITIRGQHDGVTVDVVNAAPRGEPSGLERSGGGYGLAGMRERVSACGGSLASGPTATGGWHVSALLPASFDPQPSSPHRSE